MNGPTLLFVYGTLKTGQRNHALLRDQRFVAHVATAPRYRLYDLGAHPGLVRDETNGEAVRGELWEVAACALAELDDFEEVPSLFAREPIEIPGRANVQAYFWNRSLSPDAATGIEWPLV